MKPLLAGKLGAGHIHGLDLSFEGDRVVFGWASQPNWPPRDANGQPVAVCHHQTNYAFELSKLTDPLHLYELDLKAASVTELTKHHFFNDLDPSYLPDDGIVFASDRSGNSPSCDGWENDILDTNIFKLTPGRMTIRRVTNQKDMDSHPHVLGDGRIGYLRWEYDERGFWPVHSFWVVNPDGTQDDALQRMRSSVSFAPGEVRSCTGCHETRNNAAPVLRVHVAKAALRAPSEPIPPPWGNKPMDYPTLIQPILNARCIQCHAGDKPAGDLSLAAENKPHHRLDLLSSYISLKKLVSCSNQNMQDGKVTAPKQFGAHASKLPAILADEKHRTSGLTAEELRTLYTWMDANCPYSGQIINKRRGCEDGKPVVPKALKADWGGNPGREDFKWHGVWDQPEEVPAIERK